MRCLGCSIEAMAYSGSVLVVCQRLSEMGQLWDI